MAQYDLWKSCVNTSLKDYRDVIVKIQLKICFCSVKTRPPKQKTSLIPLIGCQFGYNYFTQKFAVVLIMQI